MSSSPFGDEQLEFPVHCHFKIIALDRAGIQEELRRELLRLGVQTPLQSGNRSENGKYITFNLALIFNSKEHMQEIDEGIRQVPGVKMVF